MQGLPEQTGTTDGTVRIFDRRSLMERATLTPASGRAAVTHIAWYIMMNQYQFE